MSELFHKVEGENVITRSRGVFQQSDLYERLGTLYARKGNGFIRLLTNSRTSHPETFWDHITVDFSIGDYGHIEQRMK